MAGIDKRIEKAQKYLQRGKVNEALEEYLALCHDHPEDGDLLRTVADLYLQTGRTEEAIQAFQALIDQAHAASSFNKAIFYHRKIIKLLPHDPKKILDLAHYLVHNNKVEEAVVEFVNAAALSETIEQYDLAVQCYERIVELLPKEIQYQEALGAIAAKYQKPAAAERAFLTAATQRLARKESEGAAGDFRRALEVNPRNIDTVLQFAALQGAERRWEEVIKLLEPALEEHPVNPHLLDQLGLAYFNLGMLDKADPVWSRLFQAQPDSYHRLVLLAERRLEKNNYATALALTLRLKDYCFRIHQYAVVIRLLETILQQNPHDTAVLSQLASIHLSLNNREAYKHCLEKMFEAYVALGNYPVAGEVLDNLISVDPGSAEHSARLRVLRPKLPAGTIKNLETHWEKVSVYRRSVDPKIDSAELPPRGIEPATPIPQSSNEAMEDLFLQTELFLKYQMSDRAVVSLNKLEKMQPLPEEFRRRYLELCEGLGRPPVPVKVAAAPERPPGPAKESPPAAPHKEARSVATAAGREIEALTNIHRKLHQQQGAKAVLYTAVNELGKFLKVTRCFATLSATAKPASSYIEYCAPPRGKSDPLPLNKLLQFCDSLVVGNRRPLFSDRVADDPEFAKIRNELRDLGILSMVVWPLLSQNQVLGFIGLQQGDVLRSWTGEEILILQTVAEQVSVALAHARLRHLMKTLAVIDEETGLISRHSFFDCLVSEIDRAQKQASTLSVALVDLVHMQDLERSRGKFHSMQLLRDFSQFVVAHTRETDTAVKLDHSLIALILPDTTYNESEWVIQKLRTFATGDLPGRAQTSDEPVPPLFHSASAEALVTAHCDPADSATDVVFRAEQSLHQSHPSPTGAPAMR